MKVRLPAQEQRSGSSAAGKHKLMCPAGPEKASVPEDAPGVDGVSGTCKERSPAAGSAAGNRRHEPDGREHLKEQQPSLSLTPPLIHLKVIS